MRFGFFAAATVATALTLSACGSGDGDEVTGQSSSQKIADTYMSELDKVAGALESIDSEADIEAAAKVIQDATDKLNILTESFDGEISDFKAMRIFGARAGDFIQVQQRIAVSLSSLAQKDPEMLERISEEMQKLPMNNP